MKTVDIVAFGTCYLDTNVAEFPFADEGVPAETALHGGVYEVVPGGSAVNFCRMLSHLGTRPLFIGMTGDDLVGGLLHTLLQREGVQTELISRGDLATNISFCMTNPQGKHIMLEAGTANVALHPEVVLPSLRQTLPTAKFLFMGGCFKLKAFVHAFPDIIAMAKTHSTEVVVDHNRIPVDVTPEMRAAVKDLVLGATYYLPSKDEFCQLWEVDSIEDGLHLLYDRAPQLTVVVKNGADGAYYWDGGAPRHIAVEPVAKVVHATGAGDSFDGGVLTAIMQGSSLAEAVAYGCKVAAAKVAAQPIPRLR